MHLLFLPCSWAACVTKNILYTNKLTLKLCNHLMLPLIHSHGMHKEALETFKLLKQNGLQTSN